MITDRAVILFHSIRQNSSRVPIKVESSTIDGTLSLSLSLPYFFLLPSRFYASAALRSLCPRFVSLFNSSRLFCYAYKKLSPSPQHLATPLLARLTFFSLLFFSFLFVSAKSCNEASQLEGKLSHLRREADLEERRVPRVFRGGRIDSGSFFFKLRADIAIN